MTIGIAYDVLDDDGSLITWDDVALKADAYSDENAPPDAIDEQVVRSQSGRILKGTLFDFATFQGEQSEYSYDAAGRLTTAVIPHHTLTYGYGTTTGCGNNAAGKNGNRTSFADDFDGTTTTVGYCYDTADRLTSTTVPTP